MAASNSESSETHYKPLSFNHPVPLETIVLIVLGCSLVVLVLVVAVVFLRRWYRRYKSSQAVAQALGAMELSLVEYPPQGVAHEQTSCTICLTEFTAGQQVARLPCGHLFLEECLRKALRRNPRCPNCRIVVLVV
ncbi:hypothetical protein ACP4OV_016951 [Aristida adscensionis]